MDRLTDLYYWLAGRRAMVAIVVALGLLGWATNAMIDTTDTVALPVEDLPPVREPHEPISNVPNWATTTPPTPEDPFFPPMPPPPPPEKSPEVVEKEYVKQQADYLRRASKDLRCRSAFGNLTDKQIADMEKNGVTIW